MKFPFHRYAGTNWVEWLWVTGFHVGALLAFLPRYFSWEAVGVCLLLHWLTTSVGISMTYHRLLTHRSFAVRPKLLEYILTAIGSCAAQGGAFSMVADHRRHHAYTEEEGDPHSPVGRGLYWAQYGWWQYKNPDFLHTPEYYQRWAPDMVADPVHRVLDRIHFVFPVLLLVLLYRLGGMPFLVWGGFVRHALCIQTTWSVNSIGHAFGYRNFETRDDSRNNPLVALVTYGEGWHNNHHAAPSAAQIGCRWWEIDMTYELIRVMGWLGLAYNIKPMWKYERQKAELAAAAEPVEV